MDFPPDPVAATAAQLLKETHDAEWVRMEGRLLDHMLSADEQILLVDEGHRVVEAQLEDAGAIGKLTSLAVGSRLRVTGVCSIRADKNSVPRALRVLLRSSKDIAVLHRPSWWTVGRILGLLPSIQPHFRAGRNRIILTLRQPIAPQ